MTELKIKRIYQEPHPEDGFRILVDRLWPRGVSKEKAGVDLWCKDIAPSTQARKEFGHMAERFDEFTEHYRAELDAQPEVVHEFREVLRKHAVVTLLFAAKNEQANHALVLLDYLLSS